MASAKTLQALSKETGSVGIAGAASPCLHVTFFFRGGRISVFPQIGPLCFEMHRGEISDPTAGAFGVRVGGVKTASGGRRGSSGTCYNGRYFNDLGTMAERAKMEHFFHRHAKGTKVKCIVPVSLKSQSGAAQHKRAEGNGI